jgi:thiamine-monophosphate kinase
VSSPRPRVLCEVGEDRLVRDLIAGLRQGSDVRVGPGDDCAVIGRNGDRLWRLLKTDCLVEGRHFFPETPAGRVGWKAMARNISDIAAMSGIPRHALVTLAVNPDRSLHYVRSLYRGIERAAGTFNISVVGGEIASSPGPLFLSVAMTGEVEPHRCICRSGGRPGDVLFVTGRLGGSIRGRHLRFYPRIEESRWLTENFEIRAMMDLSDGLGADLPRLAGASGTGFELLREKIPRNRKVSVDEAISDGEDYELLFAVSQPDVDRLESEWPRRFSRLHLSRIGILTESSRRRNEELPRGYDHFVQRQRDVKGRM